MLNLAALYVLLRSSLVATCELVLAFTLACANHDGGRKLKVRD